MFVWWCSLYFTSGKKHIAQSAVVLYKQRFIQSFCNKHLLKVNWNSYKRISSRILRNWRSQICRFWDTEDDRASYTDRYPPQTPLGVWQDMTGTWGREEGATGRMKTDSCCACASGGTETRHSHTGTFVQRPIWWWCCVIWGCLYNGWNLNMATVRGIWRVTGTGVNSWIRSL